MAILSLMQFMLWMGLCGMWVLYTHVYAESIYGADKETASTGIDSIAQMNFLFEPIRRML